jgi:hypothetical protein
MNNTYVFYHKERDEFIKRYQEVFHNEDGSKRQCINYYYFESADCNTNINFEKGVLAAIRLNNANIGSTLEYFRTKLSCNGSCEPKDLVFVPYKIYKDQVDFTEAILAMEWVISND